MVTNGRIPSSQLALIDATHYAAPGCAAAFHKWSAYLVGRGYPALTVGTAADAAYRSYAWQQYRWNLHQRDRTAPVAAWPGTSNHGLGVAVDLGNYYRYPHRVLVSTGKRFGFIFDTPSEDWHTRFTGAPNYGLASLPFNPLQEDTTMYLLQHETTKQYAVFTPATGLRPIPTDLAGPYGRILKNLRNLSDKTKLAQVTDKIDAEGWDRLAADFGPTADIDETALAAALAPLLAPHLSGVTVEQLQQALTVTAADIKAAIPTTFKAA